MHKWPILLFFPNNKISNFTNELFSKGMAPSSLQKKKELNLFLQNFSKFSEHLIAATPVYIFTSHFLSPQQIEINRNNLLHFVGQTTKPIHSCKMTSNPNLKQIHTNSYRITVSHKRVADKRYGSQMRPGSFGRNSASCLNRQPTHMEREKKSNSH